MCVTSASNSLEDVCVMGAHERHEGELKLLVDNSKRLAQSLQVMP